MTINKLLSIDAAGKMPIYIQIVEAILDAIRRGIYKKGERIYSINELSNEYFLARDTVQRAYQILHKKGVIYSIRGKGFYINHTDVHVPFRILLIFNRMSEYKNEVFQSFVRTMGEKAVIDIKFHHFSPDILQSLVEDHSAYHYFAIMPHFHQQSREAVKIIRAINPGQLLLLDKISTLSDIACPAVYQDFANDICDALDQGLDLLKKYERLILVFPQEKSYPAEIVTGFNRFCVENGIDSSVIDRISAETMVRSGDAYIVIDENDLAGLSRKSREEGLVVGKTLGILAYNDSPLKQVLHEGVTVLSTDHPAMGETAARLILENRNEKIRNPFRLIRRNSL